MRRPKHNVFWRKVVPKCSCGKLLPEIGQSGETSIFVTRECACGLSWSITLRADYATYSYQVQDIRVVQKAPRPRCGGCEVEILDTARGCPRGCIPFNPGKR